jgi:hypothetical protein
MVNRDVGAVRPVTLDRGTSPLSSEPRGIQPPLDAITTPHKGARWSRHSASVMVDALCAPWPTGCSPFFGPLARGVQWDGRLVRRPPPTARPRRSPTEPSRIGVSWQTLLSPCRLTTRRVAVAAPRRRAHRASPPPDRPSPPPCRPPAYYGSRRPMSGNRHRHTLCGPECSQYTRRPSR